MPDKQMMFIRHEKKAQENLQVHELKLSMKQGNISVHGVCQQRFQCQIVFFFPSPNPRIK